MALIIISCHSKKPGGETNASKKDSLIRVNQTGELYERGSLITLNEYQVIRKIKDSFTIHLPTDRGSGLKYEIDDNTHSIVDIYIKNTPYEKYAKELTSLLNLKTLALKKVGIKNITGLEALSELELIYIEDDSLSGILEIPEVWTKLERIELRSNQLEKLKFPQENRIQELTLKGKVIHLDSTFFYLDSLELLNIEIPSFNKEKLKRFKKLKKVNLYD